jgi:succinyl-diaminopimelate desuccinylase
MTVALKILSDLIKFKSITPTDDGAIPYLVSILEPIGFKCEIVTFEDTMNLYAKFGNHNPNFCFAGHTDVVPTGEISKWKFDPFKATIEDNIIYGRGIVDMKGAIAAFISSAICFIDAKKPNGSISLLITGDEEGSAKNGTNKMLEYLHEKGEKITHSLVGEPTNPNIVGEMIKNGRRGSITFRLNVIGKQGHVAYPALAHNPIDDLTKILVNLKQYKLDDGNQYFQPSNLEIVQISADNKATNVIAESAQAVFNIRFNNEHNEDSLVKLIYDICANTTKNFNLEHNVSAQSFLNEDDNYIKIIKKSILQVIGKQPIVSTDGGTSDARFIKDYCPVIEFGLSNKTAHHINECSLVSEILKLEQIYYQILHNYFNNS